MVRELRIGVDAGPVPDVGALFVSAREPIATLVFGHGAGADMRHASMEAIAQAFAAAGISTLRFNFPFKELGKSRVDSQDVSVATVAAALAFARATFDGPHYLGGHSYGGRMATHAVVDRDLDAAGLIFGSFPLHPAGKPSTRRAEHMDAIGAPMLFLSGTRDGLADPELLTQVVDRLDATLRWLDTADHGYRVLKRKRTRSDDVFTEMAAHAREFVLGANARFALRG